jgi:hypothetical protein
MVAGEYIMQPFTLLQHLLRSYSIGTHTRSSETHKDAGIGTGTRKGVHLPLVLHSTVELDLFPVGIFVHSSDTKIFILVLVSFSLSLLF